MPEKMVYEINDLTFVKYPSFNTINVYYRDNNTDCFTDYTIKDDFEKFKTSCKEYFDYAMNEGEEF